VVHSLPDPMPCAPFPPESRIEWVRQVRVSSLLLSAVPAKRAADQHRQASVCITLVPIPLHAKIVADLGDGKQKYDWDCGLVCCQMCLKWINQPQVLQYI
jgi:hypothetical protein